MSGVAIQNRKTGLYVVSSRGCRPTYAASPKFLPTESRAKTVIRVDLGEDLDAFNIVPREAIRK